jgi:hypothetical protein
MLALQFGEARVMVAPPFLQKASWYGEKHRFPAGATRTLVVTPKTVTDMQDVPAFPGLSHQREDAA